MADRYYPNSGGQACPQIIPPDGACDCHIHIYDSRYAKVVAAGAMVANATVDDYRRLQERIGTSRVVIVQPRAHGTDNGAVVGAIAALGVENARGVAVVDTRVSDAELECLNIGGIRGIRFSFYSSKNTVTGIEMVDSLARRVAPLGWHLQLHWGVTQIVEHADLLGRLPVVLVFDHMARLLRPDGRVHPAFDVVRRLVDTGRAWVKLSGAYLDSRVGVRGNWHDVDRLAEKWITAAPQRLVWGSDWPHPTEAREKPDDAALLDLLARWAPNPILRHRILVENAASLYGFGSKPGL